MTKIYPPYFRETSLYRRRVVIDLENEATVKGLKTDVYNTKKTIEELISDIKVEDRSTILFFGSAAQEEMSTISESMLEGVRNKDLGAAGAPLNDMMECKQNNGA